MRLLHLLFVVTLLSGCAAAPNQHTSSSASWAFQQMIAWNGNVYVATSDQVTNIGEKIGTIQYYSDRENESKPNDFSNYFQSGTELYAIANVQTEHAITVKVDETHYLKAVNVNDLLK